MTAIKFKGGHSSSVLCVDAMGELIASGGENGDVTLWNVDGNILNRFSGGESECSSVSISKVNPAVYASFGNKVYMFDTQNFHEPIDSYQWNEEEINQLVLDDKEQFLAACDDSGETKIISLQEKKLFKTLQHKHTNICSTAAFRPKHQWEVFTGGFDTKLIHWHFAKPRVLNLIDMQELFSLTNPGAYMINPTFVHHINFSPGGACLAVALGNGVIKLFDNSKKHIKDMYTLNGHTLGVSQVHFLSNRFLISSGNDNQIIAWDLERDENNTDQTQMNGHLGQQSLTETSKYQISNIHIDNKINWLNSLTMNNVHYAIVADQSTELTLLPLEL